MPVTLKSFCLAAAVVAATGLRAETPADVAVPVQAYGAAHADCLEWTDMCRVCRIGDAGKVACSTPGTACQPATITCAATRR